MREGFFSQAGEFWLVSSQFVLIDRRFWGFASKKTRDPWSPKVQ
jgi:hypothetical protein